MPARTLANVIADDVRLLIDNGTYAPGEPLRQEEIAQRLEVSRIPVREALRLLEQEGVVVVHANRGAFVIEHDHDTVAELFDIRSMLESDLLRRAVRRIPEETFERLRAIDLRAHATRDKHEWIRLDEEFHFTIYAAAGRPRTYDMALTLRRSLNTYYLRYLGPADRGDAWYDEHEALLDALRRGDARAAVRELQQHLRATQDLLVAALRGVGQKKEQK